MLPVIQQDRSALRWIRGELDQSLRDARAALEDFVEGQSDNLDHCADVLHQIHGALEMVQVNGAAMLADEMERLSRAMTAGQVKHRDGAAEALMLGMVQLPAYLEKVEAGGADVPLVLLPLMNDLRAARDEPLVSESSLFAPKLNTVIAAETVRPGSGNRDLPRLIGQYRSQYHRGLLNVIRDQQVQASLSKIRDVLDVLNSAAGTARFRRLLDAAEALTIALGENEEAPALAVKPLFGKLDRVFKKVIDQGEEAAMLEFPVDLLKNLLYYIARSNSRDPAVISVKQAADLVNSFAEQPDSANAVASLGAPDRELFTAVGEALAQDLRDVKDQLDLYIRGDRSQLAKATALASPIMRIGDTLGMVGRGDLRTRLKQHSDALKAAESSNQAPPDDELMALAGELLHVESSLASLSSGEPMNVPGDDTFDADSTPMLSAGEMRQHQNAAIDEALVEMARAKDEILEFLEQPENTQLLAEVPARLHLVAGVMAMLDMSDAGQLLHDLKPYVVALSSGERAVPDAAQRDALADVVMGAELFMQTAIEPGADRDHLLRHASRALSVLGLDGDDAARADAVESGEQVEPGEQPQAADGAAPVDAADVVLDEPVDVATSPVDSDGVDGSDGNQDGEASAVTAVAPADDDMPSPDVTIDTVGETTAGGAASTSTPETVPSATAPEADANAPDVDSEILEVFAEEADEELEVIQRCLPAWCGNTADAESLQTMRRSFHTLKGSGRIVGALNIGEFAWAVENLLNRVIDGTVASSTDVLSLMRDVGDVLPTLVAEARDVRGPDTDVTNLNERAFALASGESAPRAADTQTPVAAHDALSHDEVSAPPLTDGATPAPAFEAETPDPTEHYSTAHDLTEQAGVVETTDPDPVELSSDGDVTPAEIEVFEVPFDAEPEPVNRIDAASVGNQIPDDQFQIDQPGGVSGVQTLDIEPSLEPVTEIAPEPVTEPFSAPAPEQGSNDAEALSIATDEFAMPSMELTPPDSTTPETLSLDGFSQAGDDELVIETIGDGGIKRADAQPEESILTSSDVQDSEFSELDGSSSQSPDTSLNTVFHSEVTSHLNVLDDFVRRCVAMPSGCMVEAGVRRAMHTLRGSARTAGADAMAELSGALEAFTETMQNQQRYTDGRSLDLLNRSHLMLTRLAASLDDASVDTSGWPALRDEILGETQVLHDAAEAEESQLAAPVKVDFDPELLEIFLEEAKELLEALEGPMAAWEDASGDSAPVAELQRNLHTMKGGARLAGVNSVGDLSHALESAFESVVERRINGDDRLKQLVRTATDALAQDIDELDRGSVPAAHADLMARLEAAAHGRDWDDLAPDSIDVTATQQTDPEPPPTPQDTPVVAEEVDEPPSHFRDGIGTGVLEADDESDATHLSAPLAGLDDVVEPSADSANEFADLDEDSGLLSESQLLSESELLEDSSFLIDTVADDPAPGDDAGEQTFTASIVPFPPGDMMGAEDAADFVPRRPLPEETSDPDTGGERVRVASEALDLMVNNAGEVSIYRARIGQQTSSIAFNLLELQQTIDRLRSQLRSLENETEAQILSRHERDTDTRADFDPLELDRYSTMQQLSRALSETIEDLSNLGRSLHDLNRDTDTLLLQQARVTTDLQDSLLRTRMVRFASRVSRLERVVRQTASSVGKQADLEVVGRDEDMDRVILERMMGPLEHLLRNSISHGIEDPEERQAVGKAPRGHISLTLSREGNDVVLTLSDDGRGLDRERIRTKAIERGLLEVDADVTDDDLYQLILQPGFSTAKALSQLSGRGVGMDVVLTEVKQLGGNLEIASEPGRFTRFTIRLPFTLSITDALLVGVGDDIYAIPHTSMDGVARVDISELRDLYAGRQDTFAYGGRDYSLRYLGSMLGVASPSLPDALRWLPVLLARSGEHRVAMHVDHLLGNRQIVVKSMGAQLSGVPWFTGGTILADGQIALILDTNALIRLDSAHQPALDGSLQEPVSQGVSVMVVDDSITVRKVTSRLLERHNMQVVTAKDGVDAVTQLQEVRPDVVLLDIEMPRMDGFELARHMRSTRELSGIPIIMITSRTGDKHRQRALELGVQRYLGKPYQEAELLENIYTVLAETAL